MNNTVIIQLGLTGIEHSTKAEYTFSSSAHRTFSVTGCTLGHKTNLNKSERTEIIQGMLLDHDGMKSEIKSRRKLRNSQMYGNYKQYNPK